MFFTSVVAPSKMLRIKDFVNIKLYILATLAIPTLIAAVIITAFWNRQAIVLTSGQIIGVEKTWTMFDEVYYEDRSGALDIVQANHVDRIVRAGFTGPEDWHIILKIEIAAHGHFFGFLRSSVFWLSGLGAGILLVLFFLFRKRIVPRTHETPSESVRQDIRAIYISADLPDFNKVLLYFLNLYLLQSGAGKEDRYVYHKVDGKGPLGTTVYEFKIQQKGHWLSRKISIGPIGETSGARSKCFYVIFDDHFVVKMPPEGVTDFDAYVRSIQSDRRIATALAPRECLVPRLSLILKKIPAFSETFDRLHGDDESKTMATLKLLPELRNFLKIGGGYTFFMDLSRHFFLGHILNQCHAVRGGMAHEIEKHQELIWLPAAFADRYGEGAADLCFRLQNLYTLFDEQIKDATIAAYRKKTWFVAMLAHGCGNIASPRIPPEAAAAFEAAKDRHVNTIDDYQSRARTLAATQTYKQNRARIQSICSRLAELLAWLFFKEVAIRDLKPDNLLVVGDPEKYPRFLSTPHEFELGLIDVELAACVGENHSEKSGRPMEQPRIGWTPSYATPSHMLTNEVLQDLYGDTAFILKLQDWHAVVAMIYQTATGKKLFVRSADKLSAMGRDLPRYLGDREKLTCFARKGNPEFWKCAAGEFAEKLDADKDRLAAVHVEVFKNVRKMFASAADKTENRLIRRQMREIPATISARDLIRLMFDYVRECMRV